ncbi:serine/threonine-protein kinase [Nocardioides pantholopis]|uniref:serine/threonine-protein kinase n=1 Tax=Nocardioides pantholopis TaxID=2483798 RepID=UPI000FD86AF6|nr:serine/threonine-protein kinase [Nocardioides pantholopis]
MSTSSTGAPGAWADDARRYRLESRIATGGMGEVWRATDTVLDRTVAVKLLKTEYADDASFRSRFATEARHAAALHHANIASVYDFGEASSADGSGVPRPYLVMELVDGQPLSNLLTPGQPLDPEATRYLLAQAADGLGAAHAAGIVHRDVKPANLLVTPDRQVKITDFGIARATEGLGLTQTGQVMGTPQYLSPEQARGQTATPASDVYSLGVVAFECLAGRRPFQADTPVATALSHLNDPVPDLPASVPADLARVVYRALAKDPAERYPDATSFAAALRNPAGAGEATQVVATAPATEQTQLLTSAAAPLAPPTSATPAVQPEEEQQGRSRARWLIPLLVLLAAIVVAAALLLRDSGDDTDDPEAPERPRTSAPASPTDEATTEESSPDPTTDEPDPDPTTPDDPTTAAETVNVSPGSYVGRDVSDVEAELRDQGLRVSLERLDNPGGREEDQVESVNPTGQVEVGSTIRVRYWGPEPQTPSQPQTPSTSTPTSPTDAETSGDEGGTTG